MNSRYELKRILLNLTALLMAVLMLLTFVSCSNDNDYSGYKDIQPYGMCVWRMPNSNVVRVEFVKLKQRKNEDELVFKIKEFLNVSNNEYSKETGETISFISPMTKYSKRSYIMDKLHNHGYVYEEGKEYIIMYSENDLDIYCYIPLDGLDKTCQIIKDESVDYGFSLDVPPDEFVADLKEVIVKLKMFQDVFETEDAIEWPFPLNNENQQSGN